MSRCLEPSQVRRAPAAVSDAVGEHHLAICRPVPLDDGRDWVFADQAGALAGDEVQRAGDSIGPGGEIDHGGWPGVATSECLLNGVGVIGNTVAYRTVNFFHVGPTGERSDELLIHPAEEGGALPAPVVLPAAERSRMPET
jgi:hypothetical protein